MVNAVGFGHELCVSEASRRESIGAAKGTT